MKPLEVFRIKPQHPIAILIGALLYALLIWLFTIFLPVFGRDISVQPGVVIPLFCGFIFGSPVGLLVGFFGSLLGDLWSGTIVFPPLLSTGSTLLDVIKGYALHRHLGYGLAGLVTGLPFLKGAKYRRLDEYLRALLILFHALMAGLGFYAWMSVYVEGIGFENAVMDVFFPSLRDSLIPSVLLLPLLLYLYQWRGFRVLSWLRIRLSRRLLVIYLIPVVLVAVLFSILLLPQPPGSLYLLKQIRTGAGVVLLLMFAASLAGGVLMAYWIASSLGRLKSIVSALENRTLSPEDAQTLIDLHEEDEITRLKRSLGHLGKVMAENEDTLLQQINALKQQLENKQVSGDEPLLVDTHFYRDLLAKLEEIKGRVRLPD